MIGYTVKSGGILLEKLAFAGDVSKVLAEYYFRESAEPGKDFIFYDEAHFADFEAAS